MKPQKPNKYFKFNRSQASLLSSQSSTERGPNQPSPIESPLASPAFQPPSTASSPLSPEDKDKDDSLARNYETDAARFYQGNNSGRNVLHRSQSHRTSPSPRASFGPTINLVSPTQSGGGSPRIDEDPDSFYQNIQAPPPKTELKKKRRFLGLGSSTSSEKETTVIPPLQSPRSFGRSISIRRSVPEQPILTNTGPYQAHQQWPSGSTSAKFPSPIADEDREVGDSLSGTYDRYSRKTPPIPPKDPPKSPLILPTQGPDHVYNDTSSLYPTTASSQSQAAEQGGSRATPSDKAIWTPNHHRNPSADAPPQYQGFQPHPSSVSSGSSHTLPSRSTQDLNYPPPLFSHNSRPSSRHSQEPPSPTHSQNTLFYQRTTSLQAGNLHIEGPMAPPATQQHAGSRSQEFNQQNSQAQLTRGESNYQGYQGSQGNQPAQVIGQYGPQLAVNNSQQGNSYRTPQASPMVQQNSNSEQGRNTPPPSRSRDDLSGLDVQQLLARHDELNDKYRKVKKYYFDKDAQVQQLQNTLAHQRLAQSRTSLDDNEYATRFSRLDGAINNLAFNIRKEWQFVPHWLASCVNKDATTTVTKEMTAVGRACLSRWIVDELFDRHFHPALEPTLSCQLKIIEKNLRRFAPPTPTEEEREALLAKISNWRLATLDGLQDMLSTGEASKYRAELTHVLVKLLTEELMAFLKEPAPPGLETGVAGIMELAVGIASNLPMESRDVFVNYIMPGTLVNDTYMKVEGALPPLVNPGENGETASISSAEEKEDTDRDSLKDTPTQQQLNKKKPGMLSGLMSKKPVTTAPPAPSRAGGNALAEPQAPKEERVRFAAFMAVEVRGKNMLMKAPVYI